MLNAIRYINSKTEYVVACNALLECIHLAMDFGLKTGNNTIFSWSLVRLYHQILRNRLIKNINTAIISFK